MNKKTVCWLCHREIKTEPFIHRGLSGRDYNECGHCHAEYCNGCAQCEKE